MSRVYIHYGSKKFDTERFTPIQNCYPRNKPIGGLWASEVDAQFGWKTWCEGEQYRTEHYTDDNCFKFKLAENAKILTLSCIGDVEALPQLGAQDICGFKPNFEEIMAMGYDAVDYRLSDDCGSAFDNLYWCLYGWDCDSILVLNPNVIIPI